MTTRAPSRSRGFTLIELAVVVGVVGLLLGALLVPLATQYEMRQLANEQRHQQTIRDALIGFALTNRRLPCPDNDRDGREDPVGGGVCAGASPDVGFLPWESLGVRPTDSWDRIYLYHVSPAFVQASTPGTPAPNPTGLDLADPGTLTVQDRDQAKATVNLTTDAAAVVWSTGPNGNGGTDINGVTRPAPPAALVDEVENNNGDTTYRSRQRTQPNNPCDDTSNAVTLLFCEFDDLVTWVPTSLLKLRLVEAGALP